MLCLHTIQKPDLSSFLAFDWLDLCQNVLSLHFEQQYPYKVYKVYIYRLWYLSSGCHNQIKHPISSTINLNHAFIPKSVDNNLPFVQLQLREAFQQKKQRNLGIRHLGGGVVKKSKQSQVSVGKLQNFQNKNSPKFHMVFHILLVSKNFQGVIPLQKNPKFKKVPS